MEGLHSDNSSSKRWNEGLSTPMLILFYVVMIIILVMFSIAARFGISSNQFVIVVVLWILGELAFRGFRCLAARSFEGKN